MLGTEGDFNLFATHSLKLPLSPFGIPTSEAIDERRGNVKAPLLSYTTEPISAMVRRPEAERMMMLQLGPSQRASVSALVGERNLLRLRLAHEVDFDDVVDRSYTVLRLLQLAQSDRLALGELDDGNQAFDLPGEGRATARSAFPLVTRTSLPLAHGSREIEGRSPHGHLGSVLPGRFGLCVLERGRDRRPLRVHHGDGGSHASQPTRSAGIHRTGNSSENTTLSIALALRLWRKLRWSTKGTLAPSVSHGSIRGTNPSKSGLN
jgi:hypothetical protein